MAEHVKWRPKKLSVRCPLGNMAHQWHINGTPTSEVRSKTVCFPPLPVTNRPPSSSTSDTITAQSNDMAMQNVVRGRRQHEAQVLLNKVTRADGKFPYGPEILGKL